MELSQKIELGKISVILQRKKMRNIRLRINKKSEVILSAPRRVSLNYLKEFLSDKISWIERQQEKQKNRQNLADKNFTEGEKHLFFGKELTLSLVRGQKNKAFIDEDKMVIATKEIYDRAKLSKILDDFYRQNLTPKIAELVSFYAKIIGAKPSEFRIKKMKTRWGTCAIKARRIWINLELAKMNLGCLEFIVVHEMTHLLERKHSKRFFALMDKFMPNWKIADKELRKVKL